MAGLLTTADVAERLNVRRDTVSRNARTIPGAVKLFGRWRFDGEVLDAWIQAGRTSPDPWAKPSRGSAA